ncbi:conserved Plasmodium protein, unknown function [Plasmodium relictum]|uniref:Uncharacterized protein n=1 Tax=Plasmodium relictum TaxID=85471 RepID=A0A1J1HDJ3_PLARL|nr:conserved Plasmodium protein, unknown function [Plasmodium relictum]CRH03971.1 conserved Plasmodium protein, unknown function [Plasmodium relictum]
MRNHIFKEKNNCLVNIINYNEKNDQFNNNMIKKRDLFDHNSSNIIYDDNINIINNIQLSKNYDINKLTTLKEDSSKNEVNYDDNFTKYKNYCSKNFLSNEINFSDNFYDNSSNNILSSLSNNNSGKYSYEKEYINKNENRKINHNENNRIKNEVLRNRSLIINDKSEILNEPNYFYKEKMELGKTNYSVNEKMKINTMLEFYKQCNSNLFYKESIKDENENTNFSLYKDEDNKYKDILNSNNSYYKRSNELNYYSTNDELQNDDILNGNLHGHIKTKEYQIKNNEFYNSLKNRENKKLGKGISEQELMNFKRNLYEQNNSINIRDEYTFNNSLLTDGLTHEQLYPTNLYNSANYPYLNYKKENLSGKASEILKQEICNPLKGISDIHFSESINKNKNVFSSLSMKNLNNHLNNMNIQYNEEYIEENNPNKKELNNLVKITKEVYSSNNFSSNSNTTVECKSINNRIKNLDYSNNSNSKRNLNDLINLDILINKRDTNHISNLSYSNDSTNLNNIEHINNINNLSNLYSTNNKTNIDNLSGLDNLKEINNFNNFANNNNIMNKSNLVIKKEIKCAKRFQNNKNQIENNYSSYMASNEYNENKIEQNKKEKDEFEISNNELYLSKIMLQNNIDEEEKIFFNSDLSNNVNKSNSTSSNKGKLEDKNKVKRKQSFEENSEYCTNLSKSEQQINKYYLNVLNFENKDLLSCSKIKNELNSCQIYSTEISNKNSKEMHKNEEQLVHKESYTEKKSNMNDSLKSHNWQKDKCDSETCKVVDNQKNSGFSINSNLYCNLSSEHMTNFDNIDENDNKIIVNIDNINENDNKIIIHNNLNNNNNIDYNFHCNKNCDVDNSYDVKKNFYKNISISYNENSVENNSSDIININSKFQNTSKLKKYGHENSENTVCNTLGDFNPINRNFLYKENKKKNSLLLKNKQEHNLNDNIYANSGIKSCKYPITNIKLENINVTEKKKKNFDSNKDSKELVENINIKLTGLHFNEQKTNTAIIADALKIIDKKAEDHCEERAKYLLCKEAEEKKNLCTNKIEIASEKKIKKNISLCCKNFKVGCLKDNNKATKIKSHFISKQNNIPALIEPFKNEAIKTLKKLNVKYEKSYCEYEKNGNIEKLPKTCEEKFKNIENDFSCSEEKNEKEEYKNMIKLLYSKNEKFKVEEENKNINESSCYNSNSHNFSMYSLCDKINNFHCAEKVENIDLKGKKDLMKKKESNSFNNEPELPKTPTCSKNRELDKLNNINEINIKKDILLKKKNIKCNNFKDNKYSIKKMEKKKIINNTTNEKINEVKKKNTEKYPLDIEATYKCKNIYLKINVDTNNEELIKHAQNRLSKRTLEFKLITTKLINGFIKSTESKIYKSSTIILQNTETDIFYNITLHAYSTTISTIWLYASISFFLTKYNIQNFKLKTPSSITFTKNGDFLNSLLNSNNIKKNISKASKLESHNYLLKKTHEKKKSCMTILQKNSTEMNKRFSISEDKNDNFLKDYCDFSNTDIFNESILQINKIDICNSLEKNNQSKNKNSEEDNNTLDKENSNNSYGISHSDECLSSSSYEELLLDFHDLNKSEIKKGFQNYKYEKKEEKQEDKKLKHLNTITHKNTPLFDEKNSSQKYDKNKEIVNNESKEKNNINGIKNNYINGKIKEEKLENSMYLEILNNAYKEPFIFSEFLLKKNVDIQNSNKLVNNLKIKEIKDSSSLTLSSSCISKDEYMNDMKNELMNVKQNVVMEEHSDKDKNNFSKKLNNSCGEDILKYPLKKDSDSPKENIYMLNELKDELEDIKSIKNEMTTKNNMNNTTEEVKINPSDNNNSYYFGNNYYYKNYIEKNHIENDLTNENSNYIDSLNNELKIIPEYSNKIYKEKNVNVLNLNKYDEKYVSEKLQKSKVLLINKSENITKYDLKLVKNSFINKKENTNYENSNETKEMKENNEINTISLNDIIHSKDKQGTSIVDLNKMNNNNEGRTNEIKVENIKTSEPTVTSNFIFKKKTESLNEKHEIYNHMYLNKNNKNNELNKYEANGIKLIGYNNLNHNNNIEKNKNILFTPNNTNNILINKLHNSTRISYNPHIKSKNFKEYLDYNNATFNPIDKKVIVLKNKEIEALSKGSEYDKLKYVYKSNFNKTCEHINLIRRDNNISKTNFPINFLNKTFTNNICMDNEDRNKKHFQNSKCKIYNSEDLLHKINNYKHVRCTDNANHTHDFNNNYHQHLNMQKNYFNYFPNNINSLNIYEKDIESNAKESVNNFIEYKKKNNNNDIYHINKHVTASENILSEHLLNQNGKNYKEQRTTDENYIFIDDNNSNKNNENYVKEIEHKKSNKCFNKEFFINSQKFVIDKIHNNNKDNIALNNGTTNNLICYNASNNNIPLNELVNNNAINNNDSNIVHNNLMKNYKYYNMTNSNNNVNRSNNEFTSINIDSKKYTHNNIHLFKNTQQRKPNYNIKLSENSQNYLNNIYMLNLNKERTDTVVGNNSYNEINMEPTYLNENRIKYIHNINKSESEPNLKNILLKPNIYNINCYDKYVIENSPLKNVLKKNIFILPQGVKKDAKENPYTIYKINEKKLKNGINNNYPFKNFNLIENMENNINTKKNITNIPNTMRLQDIIMNEKNISNNLSNFNIDGNNNLNHLNQNINNNINYLNEHSNRNFNFSNRNFNNNMNYLHQHSSRNLGILNQNINNNSNVTNKAYFSVNKKANLVKLNENSKDIRKNIYSYRDLMNENENNLISSSTLSNSFDIKKLYGSSDDLKDNVNMSLYCCPLKKDYKSNINETYFSPSNFSKMKQMRNVKYNNNDLNANNDYKNNLKKNYITSNYINDNIQNSKNHRNIELGLSHHNYLKDVEQTKTCKKILNEMKDSKSICNDNVPDVHTKYSYIDNIFINNENSLSKNRKFSPFFGKPSNLNMQKNENFEKFSQNIYSNLQIFQLNIQLDESTWKHIKFSYEDLLDEKVMKFIKDNKLKQIFLIPIKEKMEYMLQNDIIKWNINITEFL